MAMTKIDMGKAKDIATNKKLKPGMVVGTSGVQFTKGNNKRLEVIGWNKFEEELDNRGLAIYESKGWMKIMKK
ncbi:MAG: hypothetical protein U9R75_11005 [Candidatus Thermoplasmatota archaeon]|nr:hypothetical protein [Candidatus Thermoplasmatota archaeon]